MRVAVQGGEFAGSELATLRSARISPGILGWLSGPDSMNLEIEGLVVTIEERAGLRTNLDELLAKHLPAERPVSEVARPEPKEKPEPGMTVRIRITDSRVEIRRLPFRPPTERINPFRSDVPIRSLDEGLDVYSIEAGLLELDGTGPGLTLRADVAVLHGTDRATLKADLQIEGETVGGQVDIEGFDLDLLDPLVPARLDGRITLHAVGQFHPGRSHGKVTLDIAGLATDTIEEEWVKGRLEIEESAEEVRLAKVELSSASGRFATDGKLLVSKDEPYRPSGQLKGSFPLGPVFQMIANKQPAENAQIRFDLTTNLSPTGGRVDGLVHLDHFTSNDLPEEITLRFALQGERATRKLQIDSFALRSAYARADLKGTIIRPPHFSADLSGEASGDIERLLHLASHFDPSLDNVHAQGHGRVQVRALQRQPNGDLNLVVHAGVERLRLAKDDEEPTEFLDVQADFDGTFFDNLDRLELRAASVRDVHLKGTFQGFRASDGMLACDAELSGSLPLTQRLVELLDLPIMAPQVRPRFRATIKSDGTHMRTEGTLGARDVALRIRDVEYEDPKVDSDWKLTFDGDSLRGSASVRGETLTLSLSKLGYGVESRSLTAAGSFYLRDAAPLRRMLLDDATDWRGEHSADFELEQAPERFSVKGRLSAPKLVFLYDGHGIDGQETTVDARVEYDGQHWSLSGTELRVPGLDLLATAHQLRFGSNEPARIGASTRFEHFARYVPDTKGALELSVVRAADGKLRVDAVCSEFAYAGVSYGEARVVAEDAE
ncbi:MAG: translocation/assembly module TamB domain-containing protein, partial [Planctomycetota bacterium]